MLWLLHSLGDDNHIAVIALHVFAKDHKGCFDANMGWCQHGLAEDNYNVVIATWVGRGRLVKCGDYRARLMTTKLAI